MGSKRLLSVLVFLVLFPCIGTSQIGTDTLKIGYTSAAPFIIEENEDLEGINIWLWKRVASDLDLPYHLERMDFPHMLQALKDGDIDVSINPLTITGERSKEMEFTHSFFASHATIAVAEKSSVQKITDFVGSFFQLNFLRGLVFLIFMLFAFGSVTWLAERKLNHDDFRPGLAGMWDGFWWAMVTLSTVGYGDKAPKTRWGKFSALGLMFSGLIFVSGLTASIASNLTVNQLETNRTDFDFYKKSAVGTVKTSESEDFLKSYFFKNVSVFNGVELGLQALKKREIEAFIYDEPILKYHIQKNKSLEGIDILPQKFDVQFYAFGIRKDSIDLEQRISQRILEITESQEWQIVLNEYGLTEL